MKQIPNSRLFLSGLGLLIVGGGLVWAQQSPPGGFGGPPMPEGEMELRAKDNPPLPPSEFKVEVKDDFRYITANGIPDHDTGKNLQPGDSTIKAQDYKFRVPLNPVGNDKKAPVRHGLFAVAVNGVPYDPATNEFWNNNRQWNYEALSGKVFLGLDWSNAHIQPGGIYHYHGIPNGILEKRAKKGQMTMVGMAADGFPVYATWGYSTPADTKSQLKKLRPSYRLKEGERPGGTQGPGGTYDGTFGADWEFAAGAGDLDEFNGRTGITPEYPNGTYYYVLTEQFPFVPRFFRGTPDSSFVKKGGPPPGQGGPNGQGGPPRGQGDPGGRRPPPGQGPPPPCFGPPPGREEN